MSKLARVAQKIFGSSAGAGQIGKFGSLAAGSPVTTTDPAVIQALSNYLTGWYGAVVGGNSPAIEDMNALHYLFAYQLAYGFQAGVPEYEATTVYYTGSIVNDGGGGLYISLTGDNVGNNPPNDTTNWVSLQASVVQSWTSAQGPFTGATLGRATEICTLWATGASDKTFTLPTAVGKAGKHFFIKKTDSGAGKLIVNTTSSQTIDGDTTLNLRSQYDFLQVVSDGANWVVKGYLNSYTLVTTINSTAAKIHVYRRPGKVIDVGFTQTANFTVGASAPSTAAALPAEFTPDYERYALINGIGAVTLVTLGGVNTSGAPGIFFFSGLTTWTNGSTKSIQANSMQYSMISEA